MVRGPSIDYKTPWFNVGSLLWHAGVSFSFAEFAVIGPLLILVAAILCYRIIAVRLRILPLSPRERTAAILVLALFLVFMVTPYSLGHFHYVNTRAVPYLYLCASPLITLPWRTWRRFSLILGSMLFMLQMGLLFGPVSEGSRELVAIKKAAQSECLSSLVGKPVLPIRWDAQTFSDHVRWRASIWATAAIEADLISPYAFAFRAVFPLVFRAPNWPEENAIQRNAEVILRPSDRGDRNLFTFYRGVIIFPDTVPPKRLIIKNDQGAVIWQGDQCSAGPFSTATWSDF